MRRHTRVTVPAALAVVFVAASSPTARAAEGTEPLTGKVRLYMQTGVVVGGENRHLANVENSPTRLYHELGLKRIMSEPGQRRLEYLGLALSAAAALHGPNSDTRFSYGLTGAWRVSKDWAVGAMVGPLKSSRPRPFSTGVQTRVFACYRDEFSLDVLSQELPINEFYEPNRGHWESSIYAGAAFHYDVRTGKGGWVVFGMTALVAIIAYASQSTGIHWSD